MKRVLELVEDVARRHPKDRFFANFLESCETNPLKHSQYKIYDRAFMVLDRESWELLKKKALHHYLDHRSGQLKQGFFNQLNEAFAYRLLKSRGFTGIRFVPEKANATTPDIEFIDGTRRRYCEVKTLSISDAQIARRVDGKVHNGSIYRSLDDGFIRKLDSDINHARLQLAGHGHGGIVFLVVKFDDMALDYYDTYRRQLSHFLHNHAAKEIYMKIGISGRRRLSKRAEKMGQGQLTGDDHLRPLLPSLIQR